MADSNITLSASQAKALADRLWARGSDKRTMDETPYFSSDLRVASRALRQLRCEVDRLAAATSDRSRLLSRLTISVGD
jgi:hypothetical protein